MNLTSMERQKTDFLVIGTGIAGLYTALHLSSMGQVTVLTKEKLEDSNTQYAQGGIAAVLDSQDSLELHIQDTLEAGAGLCDRKAVEVLVKEGPERVKELIELGTNFDHIEGELDLSREGAHSRRRILHARGDATGEEIRESLTEVVLERENIEIIEESFMMELILEKSEQLRAAGALVWCNELKKYKIFESPVIVMASGGCGQIYAHTSNPEVTTGDGVAAAYRAGADIEDMEFVQFHPTLFYNPGQPPFLISETVRGEGGILLNSDGHRFMPEYHELAELAPRDIVSRAILREIQKGSEPCVYLDVTDLESEYIKERFPSIYGTLSQEGLDMTEEQIPVAPAAHYMMGGIKADINGCTSIENFYVCGEAACTGVHGANRLASNSLLEGLVFGYRIYDYIKESGNYSHSGSFTSETILPRIGEYGDTFLNTKQRRRKYRKLMMEKAGIIRDEKKLKEMLSFIKQNLDDLSNIKAVNQQFWEFKNMLTVGKLIVLAALKRIESRGGHYRSDYPESKPSWRKKHILFNIENPEGIFNVLE